MRRDLKPWREQNEAGVQDHSAGKAMGAGARGRGGGGGCLRMHWRCTRVAFLFDLANLSRPNLGWRNSLRLEWPRSFGPLPSFCWYVRSGPRSGRTLHRRFRERPNFRTKPGGRPRLPCHTLLSTAVRRRARNVRRNAPASSVTSEAMQAARKSKA